MPEELSNHANTNDDPILSEIGEPIDPKDYESLVAPERFEIERLLCKGEQLVGGYFGRVDDVDKNTAYVTLVDTLGEYSTAELSTDLFSDSPYPELHFYLVVAQTTPSTSAQKVTRIYAKKRPKIIIS